MTTTQDLTLREAQLKEAARELLQLSKILHQPNAFQIIMKAHIPILESSINLIRSLRTIQTTALSLVLQNT